MARTIRRANAQQAVVALRATPRADVEPLQSDTARDLLQRIEKIRTRGAELSNSRSGSAKPAGPKRLTGRPPKPGRRPQPAPVIPEMAFHCGSLMARAREAESY